MNPWNSWEERWGSALTTLAEEAMAKADAGHDLEHVRRVVTNLKRLGQHTDCRWDIALPSAWLHDCISVPKNSPDRSKASRLAADHATSLLSKLAYPAELLPPIHHCIEAHSFSAGITCQSLEAKLVQDADRLEALGAIGIARCLMTGGALHQRLYDPASPFPVHRPARDDLQSVDHFFAKLYRLPQTMQTEAGRQEAMRRSRFMDQFLEALANELDLPPSKIEEAKRLA